MPSTLSIVKFLLIYSIYLWFIPPIRQYKQRLFYYFLVMAFGDPIQRLITHNNILMPSNYYSTFSYLFLTAILWNKKSFKTNWVEYLTGSLKVWPGFWSKKDLLTAMQQQSNYKTSEINLTALECSLGIMTMSPIQLNWFP